MKYIMAYNEEFMFEGFYVEGIHSNIPTPNIVVDKELWSYLITLKSFKIKEDFTKKCEYTIYDKELFEEVITDIVEDEVILEPSLDSRVSDLEQENADLLLASVEQSLKLEMIEQDLADLMLEISVMREV